MVTKPRLYRGYEIRRIMQQQGAMSPKGERRRGDRVEILFLIIREGRIIDRALTARAAKRRIDLW